jgi:hypothetical protein
LSDFSTFRLSGFSDLQVIRFCIPSSFPDCPGFYVVRSSGCQVLSFIRFSGFYQASGNHIIFTSGVRFFRYFNFTFFRLSSFSGYQVSGNSHNFHIRFWHSKVVNLLYQFIAIRLTLIFTSENLQVVRLCNSSGLSGYQDSANSHNFHIRRSG